LETNVLPQGSPDAYLVAVGDEAQAKALLLADELRDKDPLLKIEVNCGGGSFKSQFKRADKSGAVLALILGESEISAGTIGIKALRNDSEQFTVDWAGAAEALRKYL